MVVVVLITSCYILELSKNGSEAARLITKIEARLNADVLPAVFATFEENHLNKFATRLFCYFRFHAMIFSFKTNLVSVNASL